MHLHVVARKRLLSCIHVRVYTKQMPLMALSEQRWGCQSSGLTSLRAAHNVLECRATMKYSLLWYFWCAYNNAERVWLFVMLLPVH